MIHDTDTNYFKKRIEDSIFKSYFCINLIISFYKIFLLYSKSPEKPWYAISSTIVLSNLKVGTETTHQGDIPEDGGEVLDVLEQVLCRVLHPRHRTTGTAELNHWNISACSLIQ